MAPSEVFLVRRLFSAQRRGDIRTFLSLCHEDIEFWSPAEPEERYHGRHDVAEFLRGHRLAEMEVEATPHGYVDKGDRVVVPGRVRIRVRGSLTDSPVVWCLEVEDGLVRRIVPCEGDDLRAAVG